MITFQDILTASPSHARTYILLRALAELNYYFSVSREADDIADAFLNDMFNSLELDVQCQVRDYFQSRTLHMILQEAFGKYDDRWTNG